ncbi:MAG TPA: thiamine pyrophosphate-dependent enzyme [Agromyces sp.]|nr:thiamine pyrophosphate-dependent enzyme [Agromyces sp.]
MAETISHLLCRGLIAAGVDTLYCLPGVQNDDFFNVLVDFPGLRPVVTRHEQGAAYMAAGAAQATGRPQAYCTVPGQGVLNAAAGHSTAFATATRVFALVGQNRLSLIEQGHGLLHEIPDQLSVLAQVSKHAVALRDPAAAPGQIAEALHRLVSGHPAPVALECPLDLWTAPVEAVPTHEPTFPALDTDAIDRAANLLAGAERPLIMLGGGAHAADGAIAELVELLGAPVGALRQGKGAYDERRPLAVPGPVAHELWKTADVVLGIGTRYSDFTTASRTAFQHPSVRFVNVNIAAFDAYKHGTELPIVADARESLIALSAGLPRYRVDDAYAERIRREKAEWDVLVDASFEPSSRALPGQSEIIGAVHSSTHPEDVIVQAAGSLPGDLHKLWRVRDPLGYHVEYAYSCMGYEIAGGLGVKRGLDALGDERDVVVMVGDGSFLMLSSELATAVAEKIKIIIVLIQNHGFASIGHLSETVGTERFGTKYRAYDPEARNFQGDERLPIDLAMNARSFGIDVIEVDAGPRAIDDLKLAVATAKGSDRSTLIHINSDPLIYAPDGGGWWDVPVADVSTLPSTQRARDEYDANRGAQRPLLGTEETR